MDYTRDFSPCQILFTENRLFFRRFDLFLRILADGLAQLRQIGRKRDGVIGVCPVQIILQRLPRADIGLIVLDDGFEAVQMARALLNEPGFVNRMRAEENARCNCRHSNYCIARMYSIEMACHQHLKEELPPCLKKEIEKIEAKG